MRRRIAVRIGVLAAVIAVLGAVPAGAAGNGKPVERPWSERTAGDTIIDAAGCVFTGSVVTCPTAIEYVVTGTHVGRAQLSAVGVATVDFAQTCLGPDGATGALAVNVTDEVIVAADGSELRSHTVYENCFVEFGLPTPFTAVRTITGGTGRFEGASGSVLGTGVDTGGATEMTAVGTITY